MNILGPVVVQVRPDTLPVEHVVARVDEQGSHFVVISILDGFSIADLTGLNRIHSYRMVPSLPLLFPKLVCPFGMELDRGPHFLHLLIVVV